MTWNISCLCINNHLDVCFEDNIYILAIIPHMGKYLRVTKMEEVCWMFVTLIRYIFPFKGMFGFAENGNRFKTNAYIWASFSYFIQWYTCIDKFFFDSHILPIFSNSLIIYACHTCRCNNMTNIGIVKNDDRKVYF